MSDPGTWLYSPLGRTYGPDCRFSTVTGDTETARWTPYLPTMAWYDVYVWWVSGWDRTENARFTVHHQQGEDVHLVDQSTGGEEWYHLGEYLFGQGTEGWVEISTEGCQQGKRVVADAVLFVPPEGIQPGGSPNGQADIGIHPNPAVSTISIQIPEGVVSRLEIYDVSGRKVFSLDSSSGLPGSIVLDACGMEPGVYFILAACTSGETLRERCLVVDQ
jgi:hypothetical protein